MLLELAKLVALLLCLLSLYAVFHALFFTIEDPHLFLQPHQAFRDNIIDSLLLLALSAGICLHRRLHLSRSRASPHTHLSPPLFRCNSSTGQPAPWSSCSSSPGSSQAHYIFTPSVHW